MGIGIIYCERLAENETISNCSNTAGVANDIKNMRQFSVESNGNT
jgi:hypothetical protein